MGRSMGVLAYGFRWNGMRGVICAQDIYRPLLFVYWTLRDYSQSRTHYYVVWYYISWSFWSLVLFSARGWKENWVYADYRNDYALNMTFPHHVWQHIKSVCITYSAKRTIRQCRWNARAMWLFLSRNCIRVKTVLGYIGSKHTSVGLYWFNSTRGQVIDTLNWIEYQNIKKKCSFCMLYYSLNEMLLFDMSNFTSYPQSTFTTIWYYTLCIYCLLVHFSNIRFCKNYTIFVFLGNCWLGPHSIRLFKF